MLTYVNICTAPENHHDCNNTDKDGFEFGGSIMLKRITMKVEENFRQFYDRDGLLWYIFLSDMIANVDITCFIEIQCNVELNRKENKG